MTTDLVPRPGDDIVPDGWWKNTIKPWADEQESIEPIATAAAQIAGLEAAYKTLRADTTELAKARRYLEVRWGTLLGRGKRGTPGRSNPSADGLERGDRDRFRGLAWPEDRRERIVAALDIVTDADSASRKRLLRIAREMLAKKRRKEPTDRTTIAGEVEIRHGDFRECLRDVCGTVDAVITDPPYERAWVPMFDDLGELAANLLTADGVIVVMTGHTYLPEYLEQLSRWLEYRWVGAYMTHGPRTRIHQAAVATGWKPLLIFHRPGAQRVSLLDDVFHSRANDKDHHHWGQSETGMAAIVERFTQAGQLVVDPCLGGGTTAVVCRDLGRRFIGCDTDADAVKATLERVA